MTPGLRRLVAAAVASSLLSAGLVLLVAWILFGDDAASETARVERVGTSTAGVFEEPESAEVEPTEFEAAEAGVAEEIAPSPPMAEPDGEIIEPDDEAERDLADAELGPQGEVTAPSDAVEEPPAVVAEPPDEAASVVEVAELEPQGEVIEPETAEPEVREQAEPEQAEPEAAEAGEVDSAAVVPDEVESEALEDVEPAAEIAEPEVREQAEPEAAEAGEVDSAAVVPDEVESEALEDVEPAAEIAEPEVSAEGGPDVSADGSADEEPVEEPDPVSFTLGGGARSGDTLVAVASGRTCAVRLDGGLSCWGENAVRERMSVAGLEDVVTVSVGDRSFAVAHACVLHKVGTVSCWGPAFEGQLGQGDTVAHYVPVGVPRISDAVALATGDAHACVVHADGEVSCWGANHAGQLGDGTERFSSLPKRVPGLDGVVTIGAGPNQTCAVHADGALSCWGSEPASLFSQDHRSPERIEGVEGVVSVAVGWDRICAVRGDGEVYCWVNASGAQPALVERIDDVAAVAAGVGGACALHNDGGVSCWGAYEVTGQPADGTTPRRSRPERVAGIADVVAIAVTVGIPGPGQHACVMHGDGSVSCWGSNERGQLGDGTRETRPVPTAAEPIEPFPADRVPENPTLFMRAWLDMAVAEREAEFPWLRTAWDYIRERSSVITSGFGGQVHSLCGTLGGSYVCWADRIEMTSLEFPIVVHELAHVYSGTTELVSGAAWGAVQLYFAVNYPDCYTELGQPPGEEILADTVTNLVMPFAWLTYFIGGQCPDLPGWPTPELQQIVRDGLAGEVPAWYRENITSGAELWAALRVAPSEWILANLANEFGGLCSTEWLTYPLEAARLPPEGTNPFRDGGCQ